MLNTKQVIATTLIILLTTVFFLVAAGRINWVYFWILSATLLIYVTYAVPNDQEINNA